MDECLGQVEQRLPLRGYFWSHVAFSVLPLLLQLQVASCGRQVATFYQPCPFRGHIDPFLGLVMEPHLGAILGGVILGRAILGSS